MKVIAAALLLALPGVAAAQAPRCAVPRVLPRQSVVGEGERRHVIPVAGYTLALSWSPEYCRDEGDRRDARLQCGGAMGSFGFILHGLWPEGARPGSWPQWCRPPQLVPEKVVRETLCAMPSVRLIQHEWEKHGSCGFANADSYFRAARILYGAVRYPDMDRLSRRQLDVDAFARSFAAANRIDPRGVRVQTNRRGWLEEVWLCLDRRFRPQACPGGRNDGDVDVRIWRGR